MTVLLLSLKHMSSKYRNYQKIMLKKNKTHTHRKAHGGVNKSGEYKNTMCLQGIKWKVTVGVGND